MNTKRIALTALAGAASFALSACGGGADKAPEQPEVEANVETMSEEPVNMSEVPTEAPPATRIDNTGAEAQPAPPPEFTSEAQTQADADAAGMTSRVARGGDEGTDNSAAGEPAQ